MVVRGRCGWRGERDEGKEGVKVQGCHFSVTLVRSPTNLEVGSSSSQDVLPQTVPGLKIIQHKNKLARSPKGDASYSCHLNVRMVSEGMELAVE